MENNEGFVTLILEQYEIDLKDPPPCLQWSLHPLRFPRYRGTETLYGGELELKDPPPCPSLYGGE